MGLWVSAVCVCECVCVCVCVCVCANTHYFAMIDQLSVCMHANGTGLVLCEYVLCVCVCVCVYVCV